ncbi:hypothetical protein [Geomesophilobacter sediminis]|uniref:Uncharacterized protein n=1 Tax=Geomesophilobacter sediminis TaxID=2798584 RepID=A0A8J7IXK2_9BACT|nr:hypothetical protein [Geomesophilobacter sediminis]MBJ6724652.1 hypothetical protein [Geomesophilobacter sediminis]
MVKILDKRLHLDFPLGYHLHCLIAQIPNVLKRSERFFTLGNPEEKWRQVKATLEMVATGAPLRRLHFLMLPESSVPMERFDEMLSYIEQNFRNNTVTMFGVEHVPLSEYRKLLQRFSADNPEALALVETDIASGEILGMPVNWCCIAVKETNGKFRVFLEAKTHPFRGEEFLDKDHDLYRGRHFYMFKGEPACFNFMTLICLDYLYRDLYCSNIRQIVDHANHLYFTKRRFLDALFVIQCNPKPEHRTYREVLSGFYGEYLEDTPGVRDTVTVFGNCSNETEIEGVESHDGYGVSFVAISARHKMARVREQEFSTDDFDGAPICRLRFGTGTRLYFFNLPLHHELDPRSSRVPLKLHAVMQWKEPGSWVRTGEEKAYEHLI